MLNHEEKAAASLPQSKGNVPMNKPKIGLLPLYLELYDKTSSDKRPRMDTFYQVITTALRKRGLDVMTTPLCRVKSEFKVAITAFEKAGVDALITLHLAYSPSLESSDALAATRLPVIVLDTTPVYDFGPNQDPDEIMYNHGIHGVQDMCNLLVRNGKPFKIEAGHWQKSDVLDRVTGWIRSAQLVSAMRSARVGRIGRAFKGMGDFAVPPEILKGTIGIETVPCDLKAMMKLVSKIKRSDIESEMAADRKQFAIRKLDADAHCRAVHVGLAVRRWIQKEKLTAFTVNFLSVDKASGLPTVPFLEASLAMARGLGYAAEGDVLTAALVGALASVYPDTTFTEMFCPDWKNNQVFLSHMGELNIRLAYGKPGLALPPFPFTDVADPVRVVGRLRGGEAVFVNLAPLTDEKYRLIIVPCTMMDVKGKDNMKNSIRGWFKPQIPIADFLEDYSRLGGTHHAALVYGDCAGEIAGFGEFMGWETVLFGCH